MDCAWCQNSSISQRQAPPDAVHVTPESLVRTAVEIAQETQQEIGGKYARDRTAHQPPGNIGVAFTYNEPLISPELIMDTAPLLRAAGLSVVLVTNAMVNEAPFMNILPHIDAMNIDLKSFHQGLYERNGGDTRTVMRNIETAAAAGCHIEITTLIIPGENDTEDGIRAEAEWLAGIDPGIPLHITRFFPRYRMTGKTPTPARTMERLAAVAKRHLRHVYLGNIRI
jgi:pyruvate formate lyase activating enzyme